MEQMNSYSENSFQAIDDEECIYDCMKCFEVCTGCVSHCLKEGGKHAEAGHIQLLMSCAEICRLCTTFMLQKSDFAFELCGLCAKICNACADSCNSIDENDFMMQECSSACRKCAETCQNMAA